MPAVATSGLTSHRQSRQPQPRCNWSSSYVDRPMRGRFRPAILLSAGYRNGDWDTAGVHRADRYNPVAATDWRGGGRPRHLSRAPLRGRRAPQVPREWPQVRTEIFSGAGYLSVTLSVGCYNPGTLFNPARPVEIHIELHQRAVGASIGHTNFIRLSNAGRARSGRFRRKPLLNAARLRTHCYDLPKRI